MTSVIKYTCIVALALTSLSSCQKVIDLDLKDAEQKMVVDAIITDEVGNNAISIIKSKSFYESNTFDTLQNAVVWVKNITTNQIYNFDLNGNNIYTNATIVAVPEQVYQLNIVVDKDTITGLCEVPKQKVLLDSIKVEKSEFSVFAGRDIWVGVPVYKDPAGRGNNYLLRSYLNGMKRVSSDFDNDEYIDGQINKSAISFRSLDPESDDPEFEVGDTLTVELLNISRPVYNFYSTLAQNSSAIVSNPANPVSNISGKNAMGVFNVATISRKSVIAQY